MAINKLEFAKVFMSALDRQMLEKATSGWMETNAGQVIYNGGNEVKVPKIVMSGLAAYDREEGFVRGPVTYSYQTKLLTQDRGRTFQLDAMDVDETNFGAAAGNVLGEFQRTKVIPEVDAYRYSVIADTAITANRYTEYTPKVSDIVDKLCLVFAVGFRCEDCHKGAVFSLFVFFAEGCLVHLSCCHIDGIGDFVLCHVAGLCVTHQGAVLFYCHNLFS